MNPDLKADNTEPHSVKVVLPDCIEPPTHLVIKEGDAGSVSTVIRRKRLDGSNASFTYFCLFLGSPSAHYVRQGEKYQLVERSITTEDVARHLRGEEPSLLSIPILPNSNCFWGALDVDRHGESDPPVDHAALAREITRLGLPLIVTRSKSPKSAHLWLFLKESEGYATATVRRLLAHYRDVLQLTGNVDVFPRQEEVSQGKVGNGINLPYFGAERPAFGRDGEVLELNPFIALALDRMAYGSLLEQRDLVAKDASCAPHDVIDRPLPLTIIQELHQKNLNALCSAAPGTRNNTLNTVAFFAARAFAANALRGTEAAVKNDIQQAALASGITEREVATTLASGWSSGSKNPIKILDPVREHAEALARVVSWLADETVNRTLDEILPDLALLTEEEYEERRGKACKRLGLTRPARLDSFVKKRRPKNEEKSLQGSVIVFDPTEPWGEPVDGARLFAEVAAAFRRFVVFQQDSDAEVLALWAVGAHCYDAFNIFPRLGIVSPERECGKTTVLGILDGLVPRAQYTANLSTATAFRVIELYHPTLLIDEMDTFIHDLPELVGVLNSGHKKGAFVLRCVGDDQELRRFATYGPVAYGRIGYPEGTLMSRSILIWMLRKNPKTVTEDFDLDENPALANELTRLRRKLARWTVDNLGNIRSYQPDAASLANRARDNWRPLLKLASVVGNGWPEKVYIAAGVPSIRPKDSDAVRVLRDIRNIFHTRSVEHIPSDILVRDLLRQPESGWTRYHNEREPLDMRDLSELLRNFQIESQALSLSKNQQQHFFNATSEKKVVRRGYRREHFTKMFALFLPDEQPQTVEVSGNESAF